MSETQSHHSTDSQELDPEHLRRYKACLNDDQVSHWTFYPSDASEAFKIHDRDPGQIPEEIVSALYGLTRARRHLKPEHKDSSSYSKVWRARHTDDFSSLGDYFKHRSSVNDLGQSLAGKLEKIKVKNTKNIPLKEEALRTISNSQEIYDQVQSLREVELKKESTSCESHFAPFKTVQKASKKFLNALYTPYKGGLEGTELVEKMRECREIKDLVRSNTQSFIGGQWSLAETREEHEKVLDEQDKKVYGEAKSHPRSAPATGFEGADTIGDTNISVFSETGQGEDFQRERWFEEQQKKARSQGFHGLATDIDQNRAPSSQIQKGKGLAAEYGGLNELRTRQTVADGSSNQGTNQKQEKGATPDDEAINDLNIEGATLAQMHDRCMQDEVGQRVEVDGVSLRSKEPTSWTPAALRYVASSCQLNSHRKVPITDRLLSANDTLCFADYKVAQGDINAYLQRRVQTASAAKDLQRTITKYCNNSASDPESEAAAALTPFVTFPKMQWRSSTDYISTEMILS